MRFGKITAVRREPGLYFKIPTRFIDTVQIIENRLLRYDIANMRLQVKGGATYMVDAFLTYRISDPRKFRERAQGNLDLAEQRIATRFDAALRQVYGLREFNAALSAQRTQMMTRGPRPDQTGHGRPRHRRRRRADPAHRPHAGSVGADLRPHEGRASGAGGGLRANGQQAAAVDPGHRRPPGRRDRRRRQQGQRDPPRPGRRAAQRDLRAGLRRRSGVLRLLPVAAVLSHRPGGAVGTTMVLSPDCEFFKFFKRRPPTARFRRRSRRRASRRCPRPS